MHSFKGEEGAGGNPAPSRPLSGHLNYTFSLPESLPLVAGVLVKVRVLVDLSLRYREECLLDACGPVVEPCLGMEYSKPDQVGPSPALSSKLPSQFIEEPSVLDVGAAFCLGYLTVDHETVVVGAAFKNCAPVTSAFSGWT
jgi:hypothetical protein